MRTTILHIFIFFATCLSSYGYTSYSKQKDLFPDVIIPYDSIYIRDTYKHSYISSTSQVQIIFDEVKVSKVYSSYTRKPFQDTANDDDWWTTPPTSGGGNGEFVGGLPIGDNIELFIILALFYLVFRIKIRRK